jgi:1-pyrroline-4-hydroxy-2-carboxylate deaminase
VTARANVVCFWTKTNWAHGVAVEITWETAIELAKIAHVVAIKDSTMNRLQALTTLEKVGDRVRAFGGFIDRLGLSVLRDIGGDDNIDGGGLGPKFAVAFYEAFWRNDFVAAQHAAGRYVGLMTRLIRPDWSGTFSSPQAQIKACMNMLGQSGEHVRPPLLPIDDPEHLKSLRGILDEAGQFTEGAWPAVVHR